MMPVIDSISTILRLKGNDVWSVTPETLVYDAIKMMSDKHVGALLVMSGGSLAGIVSERDYARKVILMGRSSKEAQVREIMTTAVISVPPGDTVGDCMRIMTENRIRHLPVVEDGKVVGLVSIGDLVKWIISAHENTIQQLERYIIGQYPG